MPWTCPTCSAEMTDEAAACRECATPKTAWTVAANRTRQLVITRASFTCCRGTATTPAPLAAPAFSPDELEPTEVAPVVSRARLEALVARGERPASRDLLVVRLQCGPDADTTVRLDLGFAASSMRTLTFPPGAPDERDRAFLLVHGAGDATPAVPGVEVVDVSEEAGGGFAPYVEVSALRRPARELTTEATEAPTGAFSLTLVDEGSGLPVAHVGVRLRLPSGEVRVVETDETGTLRLPEREVSAGEVVVEELLDASCWTVVGS